MERVFDRESAQLRRVPHPKNGDQTTQVDLRPPAHVAQDLVAGLEGPSSQDLRLCQGRQSSLAQTDQSELIIRNKPNHKGENKMENTRKSTFNLEAIAWGALFILWGLTELFPALPKGIGAIGIGLILIGLNAARSWAGRPTSGFTTTIGILVLLLGGLELARPLLKLSFELPIFAILLLALGLITLAGALKK
jgi:hypothetical protein